MKAPDFDYRCPVALDEAIALLAGEGAMPLAGGQSLMPMLNFRLASPELLVDLNGIDGMAGVSRADGRLRIGAMTRYRDLIDAPEVAEAAPLLARALPHVAHSAIRNRATIGGSCALADPAAEVPAVILALGGEIEVRRPDGTRHIAADDFFLGLYETALTPGELITAIHVPVSPRRTGFHEIARRHGDYAMAGCALAIAGDGPRVALFGVSDRAIRAREAEAALMAGDPPDAALLDGLEIAGDLHADAATKRHLAGVALRRAWQEATA